jgi:hypothetical protein
MPAFTPTSGLAGLSLLAMVDREPRHLLERRRCTLEDLRGPRGKLTVQRLFSREELKGVEGVAGLANIVLHPQVEGVTSFARLFRGLPEMFSAAILASHGFTDAAWAALRRGEVETCLRARSEVLDGWVRERFQRHARWDAPDRDRPAIAALMEPSDE